MIETPQTIYGFKVIICGNVPKMQLGEGDFCTPEFRAEYDLWLLSFFGTVPAMADGVIYSMVKERVFTMNANTYAKAMAAIQAEASATRG